ncbi:dynein regulatory complex subunit 7-like [Schistocerca gregaria]|uniref:dynein regulatory complex subunit 7-like n=1 Tax=Schistocerca gregaria TaxID=7010 RepID=UPI00211EE1C3|nr:dynein regulatory complex subunit 7-like [Schistocerca gregaria]
MSDIATSLPVSAASGEFTSTTSIDDILPNASSEELGSEEHFEELYEPLPEPITEAHLKEIAYTLGLITLNWPEDAVTNVEERIHYPQSYRQNSDKEKLILWYAENFRRQFNFYYKDRKPLFLAAENECGLQKMVCTSIKVSKVPYPELSTWKGCADFISDHLQYEPLDKPTQLVSFTSKYSKENLSTKLFIKQIKCDNLRNRHKLDNFCNIYCIS